MSMLVRGIELDDFTIQYLATALWSSTIMFPVCEDELVDGCMDVDDDHPLHGISEDDHYDKDFDIENFTVEALRAACHDCADFQESNTVDLADEDLETAGHDFWLTRNGHGAGFWDGDYEKEKGARLTEDSKVYGELHIWVDTDGSLHFE